MRDDSSLIEDLTRRLTDVLGSPVTVDDLDPVSMGASKAIWRFTATTTDGVARRLVLRADPVEAPKPGAMAFEAAVLRAAHDQGVRVPEVIDAGDGVDGIGSPFVIMTCVEGETLPPRILRDPATDQHRVELTRDLGRAIGGIHQIPLDIAGVRQIDDVADFEVT